MNHGQQLIYIYELRGCTHTHMQWGNACAGATIGVLDTFQVRPSSAPSVSHCAFVRVRVCVCVHVVAAKVVDSVDHSPLWSGNVISYTEEGDRKRLL